MSARNADILVYGAGGYTGRLVVSAAKRQGLSVAVGGRHPQRTYELAQSFGLPAYIFDLRDTALAARMLAGVRVVVHCAGPFARTARPMLDACLAARTHYLDITGEIDVFEAILARTREASEAGITVVPGVGFDVVASDCLAAQLKKRVDDAAQLTLAIDPGRAGVSPGTAKTMLATARQGGRVRVAGKITSAPVLGKTKQVSFPDGSARCLLIPWGDVSTAYHTTGIPDIETYLRMVPRQMRAMRLLLAIRGLLSVRPLARLIERTIERHVRGPDAGRRARGRTQVWGEARGGSGRSVRLTLRAPDGYSFSADAAVSAAAKLLAGGVPTGALTPALAFGAGFALELPGVELVE